MCVVLMVIRFNKVLALSAQPVLLENSCYSLDIEKKPDLLPGCECRSNFSHAIFKSLQQNSKMCPDEVEMGA